MTIEEIASVAHEANRAYCIVLGDSSQVAWPDAPDWQKASSIEGVRVLAADRRKTPAQLHDCWTAVKKREGWVYGPTKDVERKQHPCILPYYLLPEEQKVKDSLFRAVVLALLEYRHK